MRALLFAAVPNPRAAGGLPGALADVADALRARGWDVETPTLSSPRLPATQRFSMGDAYDRLLRAFVSARQASTTNAE